MRDLSVVIVGCALLTSACNPIPVDGGPCSYDSSEITARVVELRENNVMFEGPYGEFDMRNSELPVTPEIGDQMKFKADIITKGTCNPAIYSYIE